MSTARAFNLPSMRRVLDDSAPDVRARIVAMYTPLVAANIGMWALALVVFQNRPALVATALLAYTFGLRHAVDADHISAIDNVTRKLMQENKRPVSAGLFFSLGHSTIVIALSAAIALTASSAGRALPILQNIGAPIGTSISALFLYLIAAINFTVLMSVIRAYRGLRSGSGYDEQTLDAALLQRGLLGRVFRRLLGLIGQSWQMYPLGLLFGLGFDTATEVALLGIAAVEASKGLPIATILIFPLLFTVGMSLIDTTDGVLMLGAYGWAFVSPMRKMYYNMNITLASVFIAVLVGTIEALSVLNAQCKFAGPLWSIITHLSDNFVLFGFLIIALFLASWGVSVAFYKAGCRRARSA